MLFPKPRRPRKVSRGEAERVYAEVMARDGGCVAPRLDPLAGPCRGSLTRDHVPRVSRKGVREETSRGTVVIVCAHHHLDGWATAHRPLLREYLKDEENRG